MNLLLTFRKAAKKERTRVLNKLVENLAKATPVDTGEAAAGWRIEGQSIVNDVAHIEQLNHGSSKQAPAFFVEQTVLAARGVTPSGVIVKSK